MSFEGFGERAHALRPEGEQDFSVAEEAPSGVRRKLVRPADKASGVSVKESSDVRGYQVDDQPPLRRMEYLMGVDDLQREAAGFSDDHDGRKAWERAKQRSGGEVAHSVASLRAMEEKDDTEKKQLILRSDERRRAFKEAEIARRQGLVLSRMERVEMRAAHWTEDNLRDVAATRALDKRFERFFAESARNGGDYGSELEALSAMLEDDSSLDRKGVRSSRRSQELAYDEEGVAYNVFTGMRGKDRDLSTKDGLRILSSSECRAAFTAFLRERYALGAAGLEALRERVRASVQDRYGETSTTPETEQMIEEKIREVVNRFSSQIVERFTSGETDGHLGKEAGSRERFQWLQNRLLGVLRATGVLERVDVSVGALATDEAGSDVAYVELDAPDISSDEDKAGLFSRLALRSPDQWGKEFSPRLQKSPGFAEHVRSSIAELGVLSVLMQDVGGDVSAYDVDVARGRFSQKTTGDVFSVAGDFTRALPEGLAQRAEKIPALRASLGEATGYHSVPFEIACLHRLPVPEKMRQSLASLAEQLQDEANPLSQLVRQSFSKVFLNTLLAEREFTFFVERVSACAQQQTFDSSKPGVFANFRASMQPLVESAALLGRVKDLGALRDAA